MSCLCVFLHEKEVLDQSQYVESLISGLPHVHNEMRYVSGHIRARCRDCDTHIPEGGVRCFRPDCSYALCLQCLPKHVERACWDSSQFVDETFANEYECAICSHVSKRSVELGRCGHTFGYQCLQRLMKGNPPYPCPICNCPFTPQDVRPVSNLRQRVLALPTCCNHAASGCEFRGTLADTLRHQISECLHRSVTCSLSSCHAEFAFKDLTDHQQNHCRKQQPCPDQKCVYRVRPADLSRNVLEQDIPSSQPDVKTQQQKIRELERRNRQLQQALKNCEPPLQSDVGEHSKRALRFLEATRSSFSAQDQTTIGCSYRHGTIGFPLHPPAAVFWFRLAATQGLARAQFELGLCYETGQGVEKKSPASHQVLSIGGLSTLCGSTEPASGVL
eukprot:TRINITY_DN4878_c0_g2_i3.p1 TRINITY_DN4878_c0_g2~~TRINITY_DN4878_c0_g2_i3.p1  ORF type:complete len:389 (-),score=6.80 TRINITY_DN4878_c0_g2_i3:710-1876(-)